MTTAKRKLSEFGGASNGGGIEGVLKAAIDGVDEGGTLVFDAFRFEGNLTSSFEYAVFSPVIINKSILIEGETSDIRLVNKTAESPTFIVQPNKNQFFFGVENIKFISGSRAIEITGTNTLSPNSRIYNVSFISQSISSVRITTPEANIHLENVHIQGSPQYGLAVENSKNHLNLSIDKCKIENTTVAAIYINNADLNSGSVYINDSELNDNNQAIVVNNVRYYEHNIEYFQNQANYILSGSSIRLTGSAGGGGGGGGVTDHGLLTGLADDDHKQYLLISGTRGMSGSLNMNGHDITNVGNVDGVDVSTLDATLDAHILDVNNPHSTKFSNLVPETLANLNSAISDDDVLGVSIFRPFTASIQSATASIQASTASLQSSTASLQSFTASILPASASWESRLLILTNASATFRVELDTLFNVSASFRSELNSLKAATASLQSTSASLQSSTASLQTVSASLLAASSTFRIELTALTTSIDKLNSASASVEARFVTLFNASGSFRAELNSQTASINLLTAFSNSHASRHLSGGLDPIDAQLLRANGIAANRVLISDGVGGWTTVLSSAFGGGSGGPHASSHLSGGSDPIDAHLLRANGIGINRVLIADGIGGWITVLSSAIGIYDHGLLTGLTDDDHPQYTLRTDFNPFSASIQSATASLQTVSASLLAMSSSYNALSSTYYPVSASYNVVSASYTSFSASLNSASASWESRLLTLTNASATFRNELNLLTSSIVRLDSASGTFESRLISQTASINLLTAFSNSHAARHLSGAADPIDIQLLRANAQPAGTIFAANSVGGISTIHSGVFLLTSSYQGFTASYQTFTASIQSATASIQASTASLQSSTASLQTVSASLLAMSSSYNTLSSTYYPISSSFNVISASYTSFSASLNSASASWESRLLILTNASATFRNELNSQTASINLLTAFSNSHAARHLSGAADPIDIQLLRANAQPVGTLFAANSVGGISTIHSGVFLLTSSYQGFTASYQTFTASVQSSTASIQASTASLQTFSSSLLAVSSSYNTISASYIAFSASLNSASSSWESRIVILTNASATFRSELNSLTNSVVRLDSASGTFESRLISQTASINLLTAFSNSHASRHLSGGLDPIDIQLLRANAQPVGTLFAANSVGGISTIHSGVFLLTSSYQGFTASIQSVTASIQASTASLQSATASLQTVSASLLAVSSSYNTISASYIAFSASLNSASASWESRLLTLTNASATFRSELNSQTASINLLTAFSNSHASRHLSGGLDPIDAQLLRANGVAINRVLISDGLGGWTTVLSSAFGGGSGGGPHASTHLSGGSDQLSAQDLAANGLSSNQMMITNASGGWTTISSGVLKSPVCLVEGFSTSSYYQVSNLTQSVNFSVLVFARQYEWDSSQTQRALMSNLVNEFIGPGFALMSDSIRPKAKITDGFGTVYDNFVGDGWNHGSNGQLFILHFVKSGSIRSVYLNGESVYEGDMGTTTYGSGTQPMWLGAATGTWGQGWNGSIGGWAYKKNFLSASQIRESARLVMEFSRVNEGAIGFEHVWSLDGQSSVPTLLTDIGTSGSAHASLTGSLTLDVSIIKSFLSSIKSFSDNPNAHASSHLSGGSDVINAQDLGASGVAPNQLLISNMSGGWTTIASSSVGGAGGGITNILSATNEGRTLISGVFGNTAYLKTIKSLTSSVEGTQLSDTSPIILSSTNDIIYFKRRPTSLSQYFFDDFIGAVVTAAGFAWTFAAGGTGGGIAVQDIDATIFTDTYGTAIGAVYIDTGTTAAGGCILRQNPTAFSMRQMTGSSIEWRAAITGAYQAGTNEFRINLGWCNNITTASRRPTNGIFFEHTGTNAGFWNIVAVSSSAVTVYDTKVPIKTTGSYQSFKIETTQSPLNTFTSTFYIDNVVVGMISTSIPNRRNQSVGPTARISKEIGVEERGLIIDWCELFYEIYREPV